MSCTLDQAGLRDRTAAFHDLIARATHRGETMNGFEFSFPAGTVSPVQLAQLVEAEGKCCNFLRFVIVVEPAGGPVRLELSGPEGTKDSLRSLYSRE